MTEEIAEKAPVSPVSADSLLPGFGSAFALLKGIHAAIEAEEPLRGVQLDLDDRPILSTLVEMGYASQDDVTDILGISLTGRTAIGIRPKGLLDLPVEVAEVTGNIEERELLARYVEGKINAIDKAINMADAPLAVMTCSWQESYNHCAITLKALADEVRAGLHVPRRVIEGRVIPYTEDRSTGITHAAEIDRFIQDIGERNRKAGWWTDLTTGEPLKRNVGELLMLSVSELAEAMEGHRKSKPGHVVMDDHLPTRPMFEVEIADCFIRLGDMAANVPHPDGGFYDVAGAIDEKLSYNARRLDHKPENRVKPGGKEY